jgi:tetratricopeptide (TPR) repeat protein
MKTAAIVLCGTAVALSTVALARSRAPAPRPDCTHEACRTGLDDLGRRIDTLERRPAEAVPAPSQPAATRPPAPRPNGDSAPLDDAIASIAATGAKADEVRAILERVRKERSQAAFLRSAEAQAAADPNNARLHYLLARALVEALIIDPSYAAKEELGNRALAEYDRAIALDPSFWEPRFEKAESLTYYPESMGLLPDAVREFEGALKLQAGSAHDPRYAATYAHLGRLHVRSGRPDKAEQVLREGLRLFPGHADLTKQIDLLQRK